MQALAISKLMLPFLNGDYKDKRIYLTTMNNLSYQRKFWGLNDEKCICRLQKFYIIIILLSVAVSMKEYFLDDESIVGEYNNVAVIMCQQFMERFPDFDSDFDSYLVGIISHEYIVSRNYSNKNCNNYVL